MTNEPSPRPWRVVENSLGWKSCIEDADGKQIASCWGGDGVNCTEPAQSDAALIVDAVNTYAIKSPCRVCSGYAQKGGCIADERDRLRDIVRQAVETLEQVYKHADMTDALREVVVETQREARAAIGEEAP